MFNSFCTYLGISLNDILQNISLLTEKQFWLQHWTMLTPMLKFLTPHLQKTQAQPGSNPHGAQICANDLH